MSETWCFLVFRWYPKNQLLSLRRRNLKKFGAMELVYSVGNWAVVLFCSMGSIVVLKWLLMNVNWLLYETKLGEKQYSLPPGDLGWPFLGNMWSFLKAFKSSDPDSFISSFVSR